MHNPKNVLLDEPTNGLDVMSTRAVREIIRRLKGEGHTVLFSSHVMQEVSALCDTIVVIARGQIVARRHARTICAARPATRTSKTRSCAERPRSGPVRRSAQREGGSAPS